MRDLKARLHSDVLPLTRGTYSKKATPPISATPLGDHFISNHSIHEYYTNYYSTVRIGYMSYIIHNKESLLTFESPFNNDKKRGEVDKVEPIYWK